MQENEMIKHLEKEYKCVIATWPLSAVTDGLSDDSKHMIISNAFDSDIVAIAMSKAIDYYLYERLRQIEVENAGK
jgi:hypothetical protein